MDTKELLRRCQLCRGLSDAELELFVGIAAIKKLSRGEILFLEGDTAAGFYVLLSGRMRVYKASPDGREQTLHQIGPGQTFADAAIFGSETYPANSAAVEESIVAFIPKRDFVGIITGSPTISLKMIASLSAFLREFNETIESLSLKEVSARLATYLLSRQNQGSTAAIELDGTKTELARRLGTVSETLSRNLRKLQELEIITVSGRQITIRDRDRLTRIASGEKI